MLPKCIYSDRSYKAIIVRSIFAELNIMSNGIPSLFEAPCLTNYRECKLAYLHKVLKVCVWYRKLGFRFTDLLSRVQVVSNGFLIDNKRIYYVRQYESDGSFFSDSFVCVSSLDSYVNSCLNKGFSLDFFPACYDVPNR